MALSITWLDPARDAEHEEARLDLERRLKAVDSWQNIARWMPEARLGRVRLVVRMKADL